MKRLILFDLDKTLIDVLEIQIDAFKRVFHDRYTVDATITDVPYAGHTFPSIVRNLITVKVGRNPEQSEVDTVSQELLEANRRIALELGVHILPGVRQLLDLLNSKNYLGMLTGNTKAFTQMWLEATNLTQFFPTETWSLGSEWDNRGEGVLIANAKCSQFYDADFEVIVVDGE